MMMLTIYILNLLPSFDDDTEKTGGVSISRVIVVEPGSNIITNPISGKKKGIKKYIARPHHPYAKGNKQEKQQRPQQQQQQVFKREKPFLASEVSERPGCCLHWQFLRAQGHQLGSSYDVWPYNEILGNISTLKTLSVNSSKSNSTKRSYMLLLSQVHKNNENKSDVPIVRRVRPIVVLPGVSVEPSSCAMYRSENEKLLLSLQVTPLNFSLARELLTVLRGVEVNSKHTTTTTFPGIVTSGIGPDWFEGTLLLQNKKKENMRVVPLLFRFNREYCVYEGPSIDVGVPAARLTLWVDHLYWEYNALREMKEGVQILFQGHRVAPLPMNSAETHICIVQGEWSAKEEVLYVEGMAVEKSCQHSGEGEYSLTPIPIATGKLDKDFVWPTWLSIGKDPVNNYASHPIYKGYFFRYYAGPRRKTYGMWPQYTLDRMGRMNFGMVFEWRSGVGDLPVMESHSALRGNGHFLLPTFVRQPSLEEDNVSSPSFSVSAVKMMDQKEPPSVTELLYNRRIYFIGDSHIRLTFYALLSRFNVTYPLSRIWRDARTDRIPSQDITISFLPSNYLNLSDRGVMNALRDPKAVLVVGVGQHQSTDCWSVERHYHYVKDVIGRIISAPYQFSTNKNSSHILERDERLIIWLGVPAMPQNKYIQAPRPFGKNQKDCRNNARHLLYSLAEYHALQEWIQQIGNKYNTSSHPIMNLTTTATTTTVNNGGNSTINVISSSSFLESCSNMSRATKIDNFSSVSQGLRIRFLDYFALSYGMQHTTMDGVHYLTWVRESCVDALLGVLREMKTPLCS
ncbi:hypothetical protein LSM04_008228 [Trypanosoma melophagium]|uniref:uncharacterized protein n=1 Tax=Trypanosoma melophagium TaxID=715481 RepID=UPI00351A2E95|nr:hypothetical protein LSM04_008228 [Trypanosoma melophagium]